MTYVVKRFAELGQQGVVAEVLFPDFGLPFELYPPFLAALRGSVRSPEQIEVGNRAYNRWLADFCRNAPDRFAGMAVVSFSDVESAIREIRWAREAGLRGIVLPAFGADAPLFDQRYDPIWSVLEELGMPANSHTGMSSVIEPDKIPVLSSLARIPHPGCGQPIFNPQVFFFCQQILTQLIWGGVLERHPALQAVFTEMGSGWVVSALDGMDYSFTGSYMRRDVREVVKMPPSEYFKRQCHLGSSLFSLAEARARHAIGVEKIAIGVDYPHHEGTWGAGPGTREWLKATLGAAADVRADEARLMLGENAARLWGFDLGLLKPLAARVGPRLADVLSPPEEDWFPRGDVHKPLATAF